MDIALGLVNLALGESDAADRATLVELAARHGCRLTEVVIVDEQTYMPTTLITHTAHMLGAVVILAPSAEHFGSAAKALALACTLITPRTVIPRAPGWTPYR
ncbi:hypothetical protein [Nocardia higoensis]|uniref:hypothetical protein n=1 Tax=Nocardia higoensis TaxID=228599 RepID=UPI0002E42F5E|nr:hypothetical protein [Nocardia higoensis]